MTLKFLKEWGCEWIDVDGRNAVQRLLDGGGLIIRTGSSVMVGERLFEQDIPGRAVAFAAALNKLRRPLHLLKEDLDADWARRVRERDNQTCVLCGVTGDKIGEKSGKKDLLTVHHWIKTKARSGMARWARANGATVHYAEHIHSLHENPCWVDLDRIYRSVFLVEDDGAIEAALALADIPATEALVRAAWLAVPPRPKLPAPTPCEQPTTDEQENDDAL